MRISEILPEAARALADSGVPEPVRESSSILQFALGRDRVFLFSHPEYELTDEEYSRFDELLGRRRNREPLQYITGRQEFYGLEFLVTPAVLIPRPETEMLVAKGLEILRGLKEPEFAEIGVGSGCISVSILANLPNAKAVGSEISPGALAVAKANAERHSVSGRLELFESDLCEAFGDRRFDMIISNPPYVPASDIDGLQPEVRSFEPHTALTDGGDGLSIVNRIIHDSAAFLKSGGYLLMEIGFSQAERVRSVFDLSIWQNVDILPDFQAIPRMAVACTKR